MLVMNNFLSFILCYLTNNFASVLFIVFVVVMHRPMVSIVCVVSLVKMQPGRILIIVILSFI